jgi:hypothetical protein
VAAGKNHDSMRRPPRFQFVVQSAEFAMIEIVRARRPEK